MRIPVLPQSCNWGKMIPESPPPSSPPATAGEPRTLAALWYLAAIPCVWCFGYTIIRGSDLWWHIAAGRWMVQNHSWPSVDSWSFTSFGEPWLNDAWLSGVIYHYWVHFLGLEALAWWKWGMLVATFVLLMRTLHRVSGNLAASAIGAVFAAAIAEAFLDIRPQLYSLLGYSVLLHLTVGRRPSAWLPVLFLVWVQLHAIFVFGLMALAVLMTPTLLWGGAEERRRSVLIGAGCILACLINPYGVTVFTRPLRYAVTNSAFRSLGEWRPPFQPGGLQSPLYPYAIAVFVVAAVLVLWRLADKRSVSPNRVDRRKGVQWIGLALGALTLAMSLRSRRFVPLFAISQSLILVQALRAMPIAWILPTSVRARGPVALVPPLLAAALGVTCLARYPVDSYAFQYLTQEDTFPVETCNFIEQNRISGRVFAYYNWGGYLHLRTNGALKVYIDGRADMVFGDKTYSRYVDVLLLRPGWMEIVEGSGAEYVLWPKTEGGARLLPDLLGSGRWRLLYEDAVSKLLERSDRPRAAMQPTRESAWRELALGKVAASLNRLAESEAHYRRALELMPHLGEACYGVADVEALQGSIGAARQDVERCQRIYPNPKRVEAFEQFLQKVRAPGPKR